MISRFTKHMGNLLIIAGWITYLIARSFKESLPPFDPTSNLPRAAQTADSFAMYGLTVAISAMMIVGIRSVRRDGFKLKNVWLPVLGLLTCIGMILQCVMVYSLLVKIDSTEQNRKSFKMLESMLANKDMPLEQRAKWSKLYAGMKYNYEGIRTSYIAPDGKKLFFEPTSKEIEDRNIQVKLGKITKWGKVYPHNAAISWGIIGVVSILLGQCTPVKRHTTSNTEQPAPRDRYAPRDP